MATAKKPATKNPATANALKASPEVLEHFHAAVKRKKAVAKRAKPITTGAELARLDAKAKREHEKLLKTTDWQRIKLMLQDLCFKATQSIAENNKGVASASRWLSRYAEAYAKLLETKVDAASQPDAAEKVKAFRREASGLKKLQEMHNSILHFQNWNAFEKQRNAAKSDKALQKAYAEMREEEAKVMAMHGIGDRKYHG